MKNWNRIYAYSLLFCYLLSDPLSLSACLSYWEPEYSRVSFFLPETSSTYYRRFWYFQSKNLTPDYYENTSSGKNPDIDKLCSEWNVLAGTTLPNEDVEAFIFFELDSITDSLPESRRKNIAAFQRAIHKKPALEEYLELAHQVQDLQIQIPDFYYSPSEEELNKFRKTNIALVQKLIAASKKAKSNPALYEKYLYQLVKIHMSMLDMKATTYFEELCAHPCSPVLQGWARIYMAPSVETKKRNVYLAEAMNLSPGKAHRCLDLYLPEKNPGWHNEIEDPTVRANLMSMQAVFDYRSLNGQLSVMAELHPDNPVLPTLIGREINKYEDYFFSSYYTGVQVLAEGSAQQFRSSISDVEKTLRYLTISKEVYWKNYYEIALAHVLALQNKYDEAISLLNKTKPLTEILETQMNLTQLFILSGRPVQNEKFMNELVDLILKLCQNKNSEERILRAVSSVLLRLYKNYEQSGNMPMASLCLLRSGMLKYSNQYFTHLGWIELNATHRELNNLEALLIKPNPDAMERFLMAGINILDVYNCHAKKYLREQNIHQALHYLKLLPPWYLNVEYHYIFEDGNLFHTLNGNTYTVIEALTLLKQKVDTVDKIKDSNQKADEYLRIACAWFSFSNRGKYALVGAYYSSNTAPESKSVIAARYPDELFTFYYQARPAFYYIQKAKRSCTRKELKAEIEYCYLQMLDRIEQSFNYKHDSKTQWTEYVRQYQLTTYYRNHSCPAMEEMIGDAR